jgi:hypothetical protein
MERNGAKRNGYFPHIFPQMKYMLIGIGLGYVLARLVEWLGEC